MLARVLGAVAVMLMAASASRAGEPEVHVVAVNEGHRVAPDRTKTGTAEVTVDRPGKDVVLVVASDAATTCTPASPCAKCRVPKPVNRCRPSR